MTPSLPRQGPALGEKNSLPPSTTWNYTNSTRSSTFNDDPHRNSRCKKKKKKVPLNYFSPSYFLPSPGKKKLTLLFQNRQLS